MPLPLIIILLVASLILKKTVLKKRLRIVAISMLIFFTNPYLANTFIKYWEGNPVPLNTIKHHDLAVLLTGVTNRYMVPNDRVYYEHGADRVLHTIQLYKLDKIDKILISGGSGKLINNEEDIKEANELSNTFIIAGVPKEDIIIEGNSRNTHESAVQCSIIINELQPESVLLITSGFHMKRSSLCFKNENIIHTTFSTDYYAHNNVHGIDGYVTPKPDAIQKWNKIIREITGIIVYKIMGYA